MRKLFVVIVVGLALTGPCFAQPAAPAAPTPGTPSVLPRPDFHFPGNVGRTYLDSDPAQFPQPVQAPKGAPVADEWLRSFNDPQLEGIVAEAVANNLDLRMAATKVAIAQQAVIVVGSQLLSQDGAVLGGRATKDEDHRGTSGSTIAYAGVAWELDV